MLLALTASEREVNTMSQFSLGCALWTLGATPTVADLARQMEVAADIGCSSVQPWIVDVEYTPCILDPEIGSAADRREAMRIAESLGLGFSAFCAQLQGAETYGGLEEEAGLGWRIDKTKRALDTAAELGGNIVTTHAGLLPEDESHPAYQTLLRSVSEIAAHGERVGVYFTLETGQESPGALAAFIDEIGNPWLRVNYDPCNLLRFGDGEVVQGVHDLGDKIIHTHAKDWNPQTQQATCGEGDVPWDAYIQALRDIGYSGVLAIEDETGNDDMIGSIGRSYQFLRRYIDD